MVSRRQGGDSWFTFANNYAKKDPNQNLALGNREIIGDLLLDATKFPSVRRQFTSFDFDVDGDYSQSEAVKGSVGRSKGQTDQMWGSGPFETELYMSHMLEYVQLILNADPNTVSTDVPKTIMTEGNAQVTLSDPSPTGVTLAKGGSPTLTVTPQADLVPGKLEIFIDGLSGKQVMIAGYRKTGLSSYDIVPQTETITLDSSHKATTTKSFYLPYKTKTTTYPMTLRIENGNVTGVKDITIKSIPVTKKTVFRSRDGIHPGASFFMVVGGDPRLAWGAVPVRSVFRANNPIRLQMDMRSRGYWRRRSVEGGFLREALKVSDVSADAEYSVLATHPFIPSVFYPHYGRVLLFDDGTDPVIFRDAEITIDQGLDFLEGSTGSKTRLPLSRGRNGRDITARINMYYESGDAPADDFIRWDERFRDNITSKVEILTYYWDVNGVERYHKLTIREGELTEVPRTPVNDKGALNESLSVAGVQEGSSVDLQWEIVDDNGWT